MLGMRELRGRTVFRQYLNILATSLYGATARLSEINTYQFLRKHRGLIRSFLAVECSCAGQASGLGTLQEECKQNSNLE